MSEPQSTRSHPADALTPEQVERVLMNNESGIDWWHLHSDDLSGDEWPELGPVKLLESIGGGEGSGEYMAVVLMVGNRMFRKEGHYASWDQDRWDGKFREVKPVQKMITAWEEIA